MILYLETLDYLYGLQYRGVKLGLRNIRSLVRAAGNPHQKYPAIHVAGTNGKGSTASFIASIMMEAGYRTGLYTSPHLVRFTERVKVDGREIPESRLVEYAARLRPEIERVGATFFEATTCIAFQYFADEEVDIAVVETGLGGRLDATNVLQPLVSIVTNISFDHMAYLGTTLKSIAKEKGGIIKTGVPCVTGIDDAEIVGVLQKIATRCNATLHSAPKLVKGDQAGSRANAVRMSLTTNRLTVHDVTLGLAGSCQFKNAMTAVAAIEILLRKRSFVSLFKRVDSRTVARGLRNVRRNTGLHGRFERLSDHRRILLDVAHNEAAIEALVLELEDNLRAPLTVVFGVMGDKQFEPMIRSLSRIARRIVAVKPQIQRGVNSSKLCSYIRKCGIEAVDGGTVKKGIQIAKKHAGRSGEILVTGSHYVVGEGMEYLQ